MNKYLHSMLFQVSPFEGFQLQQAIDAVRFSWIGRALSMLFVLGQCKEVITAFVETACKQPLELSISNGIHLCCGWLCLGCLRKLRCLSQTCQRKVTMVSKNMHPDFTNFAWWWARSLYVHSFTSKCWWAPHVSKQNYCSYISRLSFCKPPEVVWI